MNRRTTDDEAGQPVHGLHELGSWPGRPTPKLPQLVDPYDESADLGRRARSYLQTNCAHCHQFNAGGAANIALGFELPLEETKTVDVRPIQGTFNIAGASIIAPGRPGALGAVLPRLQARGRPDAPRRLGPGRRARDPDDPRLDRTECPRPTIDGDAAAKVAPEDRAALESLRQADRSVTRRSIGGDAARWHPRRGEP